MKSTTLLQLVVLVQQGETYVARLVDSGKRVPASTMELWYWPNAGITVYYDNDLILYKYHLFRDKQTLRERLRQLVGW